VDAQNLLKKQIESRDDSPLGKSYFQTFLIFYVIVLAFNKHSLRDGTGGVSFLTPCHCGRHGATQLVMRIPIGAAIAAVIVALATPHVTSIAANSIFIAHILDRMSCYTTPTRLNFNSVADLSGRATLDTSIFRLLHW